MKKYILLLLCLFCFVTMLLADVPDNIIFINSTGYAIMELYISPNDWEDWGENLLYFPLEDGESTEISLVELGYGDAQVFDIKAVDTDDDIYTRFEVTLESDDVIEFTFDDFEEHYEEDYYGYDEYFGYDEDFYGYEDYYDYEEE